MQIADGSGAIHTETREPVRFRLIRSIDDPGTRQRWLLLKDLSHPANPALLFQATPDSASDVRATQLTASRSSVPASATMVIHAGDPIILSEHSRVFDAEFEATALESAAAGERLAVRMKIGGRTVKAVATAHGHATRVKESSEERP